MARRRGVSDRATTSPVSTDTPSRLASVTKTYMAALTLRFVDEGVVDPDERVELDGVAKDATLRQLLHHTRGLPTTTTAPGPSNWRNPPTPKRSHAAGE